MTAWRLPALGGVTAGVFVRLDILIPRRTVQRVFQAFLVDAGTPGMHVTPVPVLRDSS